MEELHLEVQADTVRVESGYIHGIVGEWNGKPVPFFCDSRGRDIMIPESMEPIYPVIEAAVRRYLMLTGRI